MRPSLFHAAALSLSAPAAPSAVLLPADSNADFQVGLPMELRLEVHHQRAREVVVADLPWPEGWAERGRARTVERSDSGTPVEVFRFEVIPFETGRFTLGPFEVEVGDTSVETTPLTVTVRSNLPPEVQSALTASTALPPGRLESLAAPDPNPVALYGWNVPLFVGVGVGLLSAVLALVAWRVWTSRRARHRSGRAAASPTLPPADRAALEALNALARERPAERGGINPYYTALSRIFRTYLERHFRFDASELTLEELDDALSRLRWTTEDRSDVLALLEEADYAKFARWEPDDDDAHRAVRRAIELVTRTRTRSGAIGADRDLEVPAAFPEQPAGGGGAS